MHLLHYHPVIMVGKSHSDLDVITVNGKTLTFLDVNLVYLIVLKLYKPYAGRLLENFY